MALFFKRYLQALGVVAAVMIVYRLTVVPAIEPQRSGSYPIPDFLASVGGERWWTGLFEPNSWQLKQPTVVQNENGVLLAETWEQVDQRTWKLTPLTIVMSDALDPSDELNARAERPVWVIRSNKGATIHFEQPLDPKSGTVPSILRGQLDGDIRVELVSLVEPGVPQLQINTRNITIDRRRIWTQDEVEIESPQMKVRGRVLRVGLIGDILSKDSDSLGRSDSASMPIEELELMHLTQFQLGLDSGGIWSKLNPSLLQGAGPIKELPAMIQAECGGRFTFNFSKNLATLGGGVHLRHVLPGLPADEFHCHKINIRLAGQQASPASARSDSADPLAQLNVREVEAFGIDSLEDFVGEMWVEFQSPILGATARAKRVKYDFARKRIELAGKLDQPGATISIAELNYRGFQVRAPLLEYQAAPPGEDGRPQHGGWMVAQGAGEITATADSPIGQAHARWQDSFKWAPAQSGRQQWIELSGKTLVESPQHGFITAERLEVWLAPPDLAAPDQTFVTAPADAPFQSSYRPSRILTAGPTLISARNVRASVETMDLSFVYPSMVDMGASSGLELQDSSGDRWIDFLAQPGEMAARRTGGLPVTERDRSDPQPLEIDGRGLVAAIAMVGGQAWIDSLTAEGPLTLKSATDSAGSAFQVRSQSLTMSSSPQRDIELQIIGQPAEVFIAGGIIRGPSIQFNQSRGSVWMNQPGDFTLPAEALNSLAGNASLRWDRPLQCTWQQHMNFDGQTIRLEGDIQLTGALRREDRIWLLEGLSQQLDLQLAQPIDLRQLRAASATSQGQLSHITLRNNVDLRMAQRSETGERLSLQRLVVPTVTVYVPQEKIVANGPGRGLTKFSNQRSLGSLAGSSSESSRGLYSGHLAFRDTLVAFLARNEIVADGSVRIATSPIQDWDQELDPFVLSRLEPGQMSLSSDQIKLYDTSPLNSTQGYRSPGTANDPGQLWEAQATGNVVFDGNTISGQFAGSAYQVTFVQGKDRLAISGDGRTKALLRIPSTALLKADSRAGAMDKSVTTVQVDSAVLNVKTNGLEESQGLQLQMDLQSDTAGASSAATSAGIPTTKPNAGGASLPNPRDSIQNFLRGTLPQPTGTR
ncbi:MAG: hypothetical protein KF752_08355 [Pirellulaceae bacterium]|nr:hypothetical protein [Pirellulaceae bacterium]